MALALYRKYRPRTFAEVIGQEHVTEPLSQALRSGRLNHAYLFSGPRGCGKTSSARILARSLNCEKGPTPDPCGECQSCRDLAPDGSGSIDVIEIDAASHGGVDDARELRERAFFAPVASRFKVYVIDEAHMVSSAGFNALLKLVEEPPEYVKFVFATTEPEKVLGTIKSRTHHYPFRLIPPGVLRPYLEQLCEREGVTVEPAVFPLVVRAGGGSARDSLSVLDQLIAGAGPDGVGYARAVALLGVTDVALIDEMCDALAVGDGGAAYATIDRVAEAGHDPRRFASDLLERLRDLIVLQQVPDAAAKGLIDAPADQLDRMAAQANRIGPETLSRFADILHTGLTEMRGTTAPRLLLELVSARMLLPGAEDSSAALLQRLERMERRLGAAGEAPPPSPPPPSPPPVAQPSAGPQRPATQAPAGPQRPAAQAPAVPEPSPAAVPPPDSRPAPAAPPSPQPPTARQTPADHEPARRPVTTPAGQTANAAAAPATTTSPSPAPAVTPNAAPAPSAPPGALDAAAVRRVWDEILTMVRRQSVRAWAVVREANVREVEGNTLVLVFRHLVHADMLSKSPEVLTQAIAQVLGGTWHVRCEVASGGGPSGGGTPPAGGGPSHHGPAGGNPPPRPGSAGGAPPQPGPAGGGGPPAPRSAPPAAAADEGWPTTARPGGVATASAATARPAVAQATAEDWPTTAQPGGGSTGGGDLPAPSGGLSQSAGATMAVAASPVTSGNSGGQYTGAGQNTGVNRSAAAAAARAAAGLAASRQTGGQRPAPAAPGQPAAPQRPSAGGTADEPPYDPDYDPPVGDPQYPGFDPGDEPLDDAEASVGSSEEQALRLLAEALGAEPIGEPDNRRS